MPKPSSGESVGTAETSPFQKWEMVELDRSEIKEAPYNPRRITDRNAKKLRENLKRVGLLAPLIWNRRTGNLVSGHQRLKQLDSLHRGKPYRLRVAAVDLDEKTEREQNVFLNNPEAMGEWEIEKLAGLFRDDKINNDFAGFDLADVYQLFGDDPEAVDAETVQQFADEERAKKQRHRKHQELFKAKANDGFYIVAVFVDDVQRDAFLKKIGLPANRFVDGRVLEAAIDAKGQETKTEENA